MKKLFVIGLVATLATAQAEEAKTSESSSTSSTKLEAIKKNETPANTTGQADADDVITNRKLRAESGAKKLFSFSADLNYAGGTVKNPGSKIRPNLTGSKGTQATASGSGTIGVKLRLSPLQSLNADIGIGMDTPFHSDAEKSRLERSYIQNPSVGYQVLSKVMGVQSVTNAGVTKGTSNFSKAYGYDYMTSVGQTLVYDFGGSNFSLGASLQFGYNFFNKSADATIPVKNAEGKTVLKRVGNEQADMSIGFFPMAELVLTDKLNLRTVSGVWMYDHDRDQSNKMIWGKKQVVYQSIGLGVSVTRDIYLYPNVQFIPDRISVKETNVAVSATINL